MQNCLAYVCFSPPPPPHQQIAPGAMACFGDAHQCQLPFLAPAWRLYPGSQSTLILIPRYFPSQKHEQKDRKRRRNAYGTSQSEGWNVHGVSLHTLSLVSEMGIRTDHGPFSLPICGGEHMAEADIANCVFSAAGTLLLTGTLIILHDLKISLPKNSASADMFHRICFHSVAHRKWCIQIYRALPQTRSVLGARWERGGGGCVHHSLPNTNKALKQKQWSSKKRDHTLFHSDVATQCNAVHNVYFNRSHFSETSSRQALDSDLFHPLTMFMCPLPYLRHAIH